MAEKGISKNKVKKRLRNPNKNFDAKQKVEYQFCVNGSCSNPRVRLACYELTPYFLVPLLTFSSRSVHFLKLIGYAIYCNFYGCRNNNFQTKNICFLFPFNSYIVGTH